MSLAEVAKSAETRRKEQQFGLANNAFGAAAGAIGTKAVYNQAREKHYPEKVAAQKLKRQQKAADRAAARFKAGKNPFTIGQRASAKVKSVTSKVPKRVVAPAAIAGGVGMQLVNAGADAQSAGYFARELTTNRKSKVAKADDIPASIAAIRPATDGIGRRIEVSGDVSKRARRFDSEVDRQHRLGVYEGLGLTGAAAGAGAAGYGLKLQGVKLGNVKRKLHKHRLPLAGAGLAALSGTTAAAARRSYNRDRNQPWT